MFGQVFFMLKGSKVTEKDLTFLCHVTYEGLERERLHTYAKYRTKVKIKGKFRYYVKCAEEVNDDDGNVYNCGMGFEREDYYKPWLQTHIHTCTIGSRKTQITLESFQTSADSNDKQPKITNDYLHRQMAVFTGQKNLSFNILTSPEFYNLAINFISYGLFIAGVKNYREKALESFNQIK